MAILNLMYGTPALTDDASPTHTLGTLAFYDDPTYGPQIHMYVKFTDAVTYAAYQPLGWSATEGDEDYVVTNDVSEDNGAAAGVANRVHTTGYYGWMCVSGVIPLKMNTDDDAADGNVAILGGDGVANTGSVGADSLGIIVEAVVGATDMAVVRLRGLI